MEAFSDGVFAIAITLLILEALSVDSPNPVAKTASAVQQLLDAGH